MRDYYCILSWYEFQIESSFSIVHATDRIYYRAFFLLCSKRFVAEALFSSFGKTETQKLDELHQCPFTITDSKWISYDNKMMSIIIWRRRANIRTINVDGKDSMVAYCLSLSFSVFFVLSSLYSICGSDFEANVIYAEGILTQKKPSRTISLSQTMSHKIWARLITLFQRKIMSPITKYVFVWKAANWISCRNDKQPVIDCMQKEHKLTAIIYDTHANALQYHCHTNISAVWKPQKRIHFTINAMSRNNIVVLTFKRILWLFIKIGCSRYEQLHFACFSFCSKMSTEIILLRHLWQTKKKSR